MQPILFILDDDIFSLSLFEQHFRLIGQPNIYLFSNSVELFLALENRQPHIAFIDVDLNTESGLDVLVQIKAKYPQVYVLMVSGLDKQHLIDQALNLGAYDYIVKSDKDEQNLKAIIQKIMKEYELLYK